MSFELRFHLEAILFVITFLWTVPAACVYAIGLVEGFRDRDAKLILWWFLGHSATIVLLYLTLKMF